MTSLKSGVKLTLMKKLSLYIFLVLMFCNVGFAEDIYLIGTTWTLKDTDGDIQLFRFHKDQRCSYKNIKFASGNEGINYSVDTANCNWKINTNLVTWEIENYFLVRTAIINGTKMSGNFVSVYNGGVQGTFTGTKNN